MYAAQDDKHVRMQFDQRVQIFNEFKDLGTHEQLIQKQLFQLLRMILITVFTDQWVSNEGGIRQRNNTVSKKQHCLQKTTKPFTDLRVINAHASPWNCPYETTLSFTAAKTLHRSRTYNPSFDKAIMKSA